VEAGVSHLPNVEVFYVDQVSKLKDDNLQKRAAEVPKAKIIIASQIADFMKWHEKRKQIAFSFSKPVSKVESVAFVDAEENS
jgi:glutamyl-tRNA reductase